MNFYPDYDILYKMKENYDLLPIMYEEMADMITPVQLLNRLRESGPCFLLESAESGETFGRYSFIGIKPDLSIKVKSGRLWIDEQGTVNEKPVSNPLSEIKKVLSRRTSPVINGFPAFTGGLVGYFGYDTVRYVETTVNNPPPDDTNQYDLQLLGFNDVIVIDHLKHKLIIISNINAKGDFEKNYKEACSRIQELLKKTKLDFSPAHSARRCHPVTSTLISKERYMQNVERAVNYIKEGEIFQVVPSQRFCVEDAPDPFNVYRVLRAENPSPYMYFLQLDDCYVAGTSPEKLVSVDKGVVTNHPIAGTIRRGCDDEEDKQLMEKLLSDPKERAEHTMLVDLGRNDLGKICRFGSVKVEELMKIEKYSRLMHIVSTVTGRLEDDKDCVDALAAVLPAGTLSGAPKVRAMQIIDELETARRGLYGGAIGYIGYNGIMDTCIAIRTALFKDGKAYVQSGGGVVADSIPEKEYAELSTKASAVLSAIETAAEMQ